jgi:hypothetical protein
MTLSRMILSVVAIVLRASAQVLDSVQKLVAMQSAWDAGAQRPCIQR